MIRLPGWPARLEAFLSANRPTKFAYGEWDCALFVADAIDVMTGIDIAAPYRGQYFSRAQAFGRARELAMGPTVQAIAESVTAANGMPEIPVLQAGRGDVVLLRRAGGRDFSLGLVAMSGMEILIALKHGFGTVPLERACRAWRV